MAKAKRPRRAFLVFTSIRLEVIWMRRLYFKYKPIIGNFITVLFSKNCQFWMGWVTLMGNVGCKSATTASH